MVRQFIVLLFSVCLAEETIKYAAVIFRHGDRTPVDTYPTDPYKNESFWPVRFGELTNIGKQQHYALGQWFRRRYSHLLSKDFDPKQIQVRSTDVDRTLMSAQANLAGMYPPVGKSIWNKELMWQPIPIHTMPEAEDEVLAMKKNCNAYNREMERYTHTAAYKQRLANYQSLMNYLSAYTGEKVKDYVDMLEIYSTLYIETLYNFTLPSWTKTVFPDKLKEPACYSFGTSAATPLLARLRAGPILKDIMKKVHQAMAPEMDDQKALKVSVYSGHDYTIGTVLTALGLFDGNCPVYTATILIELIQDTSSSSHYIRISYRNSSEIVEPAVLYIPYCGQLCHVDRFNNLYKNLLTVNFNEECNKQATFTTAGMSCLLGILFIMSVLVALKLHASRNKPQQGSHNLYTKFNSSGKVVFI
ncbi:histidine phosphatase superfamily (branch 2) domain-containing protein [Phthorimaea operculella]|nr:histidine phosphatase superfamily (branch 2) domain-containing protein [Phthorimaea operculella]